jgi:hypothetical protein
MRSFDRILQEPERQIQSPRGPTGRPTDLATSSEYRLRRTGTEYRTPCTSRARAMSGRRDAF